MSKTELTQEVVPAKEVQKMFGITRATEIKHRNNGRLPRPITLGRRVYYLRTDIEKMLTRQV